MVLIPYARMELPTFYYHNHFTELLDFVSANYAHVLRSHDIGFIESFRGVDKNAQCLYVRLVNRKGRIFAANKLNYPELGRVEPLITKLRAADLIGDPDTRHFDAILNHLTKNELHRMLSEHTAGISRSLRKSDLVDVVRENVTPGTLVERLRGSRLVVQRQADAVRYLMFLFFGRIHESMSQFTMRDLGLVRAPDLKDTYEPRFGERAEALEHYYYANRMQRSERARERDIERLVAEAADWPEPMFAGSARIRDKLAYRLGRALERAGRKEQALEIYATGESAQCVERRVRTLFAEGRAARAQELLEECLASPRSEEEWLIARDLYEQKVENKRTSLLTDTLRNGDVIDIDESRSCSPERAAVEHFERIGAKAYRVENAIWRTLFGLLFWDELFEVDDTEIHSPFEFLPASLKNGAFYSSRKQRIEERLAGLDDTSATRMRVLRTSTRHYGTPNGVFRWNRQILDALFALVDSADSSALRSMVKRFCEDYANARYGYPDLLVIDDQGPRFVEIKTEGDHLRRKQMLRLEQLRAAGFRADVVRINWVLDPEQLYVVVDVETTGGRGEHHRVTEIGAVKMQNGRIIDRFATLLNPQRSIPAGITRLTGISADMVADAPYFADIADEFSEFMGDAIFVAHNVDFDYRFLAQEYRRLGRPFRYAKLCTCASMRRLYPGQRSYSLAALCQAHDIPLRNHHRALCDAEAAAELLLLVNEKRAEAQEARVTPY